jgi:O-antigen/teichoic acid export membrane protein
MSTTPGRHIARSALWNHLGKVAEYALLYISSVVIARALGVDENGRYAGTLSFVQLLLVFGSFGIETTLNTHLPQITGPNQQAQSRYLVRRGLALRIALIVLLVAPLTLLAGFIGGSRLPVVEFAWTMVGLALVRGIALVLSAVLTTHFKTTVTSAVNVTARLAELVALLILARSGASVQSILAIMIAGALLQTTGYLLLARTEWFGPAAPAPIRPLVVFGGIFWINTAVDYFLGRQGDIFFLTLLLPASSPASLYDVAYSVTQAMMLGLTVGLSGIVLAAFASMAKSMPERMTGLYEFIVRALSLLTIPALVFVIAFAGDLIPLVYTHAYAPSVLLAQILLGARVLSRLTGWGESTEFLLARGKVRLVVIIGVISAATTIGLHLLLIPRYGAVGAACGSGIGTLAANTLAFSGVRSCAPVTLQWRAWLTAMVASLLAAGAADIVPAFAPPLVMITCRCMLFCAIALLGLYLFKPLDHEDLPRLEQAIGVHARKLAPFIQLRPEESR